MFRSLQFQTDTLSSLRAVIEACLSLGSSFISLSFSFVRRSGNSLVHSIATLMNVSCNEGLFPPSDLMQ